MKFFWALFSSFIFPFVLAAQAIASFTTVEKRNMLTLKEFCNQHVPVKNFSYYSGYNQNRQQIIFSDTPEIKRKHNKYGNLTSDDTLYNRKYAIWIPMLEVIGVNGLIWSIDRFILNVDYARIGPATWKRNFREEWEWDQDAFGINFIAHPYSGTLYYNAARANGYNLWASAPFAIGGSLMWEYFGENTRPSYNDLINTPVNGVFLGEILFRLSENILDDQSRGAERFFREVAAGLISPMVGLNRLIQGKTFRILNKEVYQKEPCNISLFAGIHKINTNREFLTGQMNEILNLQIDYGDPFEGRIRKPFDVFRMRFDLSYGKGKDLLDHISGFGNLWTHNSEFGKIQLLSGLFQYYDYWDNETFELGTIGFGEGIITRLNIHNKSNLYTSLHLGVVPFGGSSTRFGPDTTIFRDYNFGGGLEGKFEATFNLGNAATFTFKAYYFWLHTYQGLPGDNFIGILKPRITLRIIKDISIGIEEYVYINDRFEPGMDAIHRTQTEQKIFLLFYLENKHRSGHYN